MGNERMVGGTCCCFNGDTSRCPLHQTEKQIAELRAVPAPSMSTTLDKDWCAFPNNCIVHGVEPAAAPEALSQPELLSRGKDDANREHEQREATFDQARCVSPDEGSPVQGVRTQGRGEGVQVGSVHAGKDLPILQKRGESELSAAAPEDTREQIMSAESWLANRSFSDSRPHSSVRIAELMEEYFNYKTSRRASLSGSARPTRLESTDALIARYQAALDSPENADCQASLSASVRSLRKLRDRIGAEGDAGTQPWISVKERLPEKFEQVLAHIAPVPEGPDWYPRTSQILAWQKRGIWFGTFCDPFTGVVESGEIPDDVITHWMPLPEPPVSGDKEKL